MIRPTRPSHARLPLFAAAIWLSPLAALLLAAPPALAQADSEEELAELRRRGDDLQAAGQLEARGDHATSARLRAELGLAYQGAGRYLDAERHLQAALRAAEDPWIGAHRAGLELALELAGRHLGWVHIACSSPGLYVVAREGRDGRMPCGTALRVAAGTLALEARAPGRQSQRLSVEITAGARAEVDPSLGSHECAEEGTIHIGGAGGGCCWPGQLYAEGSCAGVPDCPPTMMAEGQSCAWIERPRRLAGFRLGLFAGVMNFIEPDTGLFRRWADAGDASTGIGPRVEVRLGTRLYRFLELQLVGGATLQDVQHWYDCTPGSAGCSNDIAPKAYGFDAGLMLMLHTNPIRGFGAFDLHIGAGVRPWATLLFDSSLDGLETASITATVLPAELGISLSLGAPLSLDLVGQANLWLPWSACASAGTCFGSSDLAWELSWSALAGLTIHVGG